MLLGGAAAAWPLAARAQRALLPAVGYLSQGTPEVGAGWIPAVRKGLGEAGLVEGKDFTSEFRWARYQTDRLPALAADLVQRRVAVIITLDTVPAARAAKAATTEIPVVFAVGTDPVRAGLVETLNRPGGNVTGISSMNLDLGSKWVGLLRELRPAAMRIAVLVDIENPDSSRSIITGTQGAALTLGMQTEILFGALASGRYRQRIGGRVLPSGPPASAMLESSSSKLTDSNSPVLPRCHRQGRGPHDSALSVFHRATPGFTGTTFAPASGAPVSRAVRFGRVTLSLWLLIDQSPSAARSF
jgi:hypothetical protein